MSDKSKIRASSVFIFVLLIFISSWSVPMGNCPTWPEQAEKMLYDYDLESCSCKELRLLRNEIYARHGRRFKSKDLQKYFESQSWYKYDPRNPSGNKYLNKFEKQNASYIAEYEKRIGCHLEDLRKTINLEYVCKFMGFKVGAIKTFKAFSYDDNKYILETEKVLKIVRESAFKGKVIVSVTSKGGTSYYEGEQEYEIQGYKVIPFYGDDDWIELPFEKGLQWPNDLNYTIVKTGIISVKTPAKTFTKCWDLESEGGDSVTYYSYCDGIGLVKKIDQIAGQPKKTIRLLTSYKILR